MPRQREYSERLFDEVPCWISVQDREFRIVDANRKLIEQFGDRTGQKCYQVYKGRTERCPECPVWQTFEDGREHTAEQTVFDRRGIPREVVVNTRPLRGADGQVERVMQLFTDITVQKQLENRLHESVSRFQNLFDTVPCFLTVIDRDYRVVEANRHFIESFGEDLTRRCYEIYKRRTEPCPKCPVAETFEDGRSHYREDSVVDENGHEVYVVVHTAPIRDARGEISTVMEVSDDITEIRLLQDKLATLGRLVGGVAHSIKNVLEGLRGGVYIVNLGFKNNNQTDVQTGWEMVQRNVRRVSSMIMDMLYCARERSPRRLPVSLEGVFREVREMYAARAAEYGVKIEAAIAPEAEKIFAEPRDIHALVSNLVGNAVDACIADQNEGRAYRVALRAFREDGQAVIEVEDNGVGMDAETRARLFTMFFSTKGSFGTGLGLLVCHKVTSEHGGTIAVASDAGAGSTFTVRLPLEGPQNGNDSHSG